MAIPDWQLPPGVDRGLWDYLHAGDMIRGYDEQMAASPLTKADVVFCEAAFPTPGRLIDLGCGTGRLCVRFAAKGYDCVGVDLSEEMLAKARANATTAGVKVEWVGANLVSLWPSQPGSLPSPEGGREQEGLGNLALPEAGFDYAACLFSTLGMVRGMENRAKVVANAFRLLNPGGRFVLHVHNRYFRGLGWGRVAGQWARTLLGKADAGDITMSQPYGGAPLTLHHFTRQEAMGLLRDAGFRKLDVRAIGLNGEPTWPTWRVYGWLILGERGV